LDLETNDVRLATIEMLMINKHITPDSLLAAVNCFIKQFDSQGIKKKKKMNFNNRYKSYT
jgi:hypothetical protein